MASSLAAWYDKSRSSFGTEEDEHAMGVPRPEELRQRHTYYREGYVQDLLACLITGGDPPRWNTPASPTDRGWQFLDALLTRCGWPPNERDTRFFSEFELPRRHDGEVSGWPDFALLSSSRLVVIELKTEPGSHRRGQLGHYADLSAHHYPTHARQLGYITPPLRSSAQHDPVPVAHLTWQQVAPLVEDTWARSTREDETYAASVLTKLLSRLAEPWTALPASPKTARPTIGPTDPLGAEAQALLQLAGLVADDGRQRAADVDWPDPDSMEDARLQLRDRLQAEALPVQPWIWRAATSGGRALSDSGQRQGYELRFSRLRKGAGN